MPFDIDAAIAVLRQHLKASEFADSARTIGTLVAAIAKGDATFNEPQRKAALGALRAARQFEPLAKLAQALMLAGHDAPASAQFDPMVRRQYAQALIETKQIAAALDTLRTGVALIATVPDANYAGHLPELREMQGLLGRVHKQLYVDAIKNGAPKAAAADLLNAAHFWYETATKDRDATAAHWPLVNLIAVTARAERDGLMKAEWKSSNELLAESIGKLEDEAKSGTPKNKDDQPWLRASLGESCVGMRDWPEAAKWYAIYAAEDNVGAFELESARRQLEEVWQINPASTDGGELLRLLEAARSRKPGGSIVLDETTAQAVNAGMVRQSIIESNQLKTLDWIEKGLKCAPSVAGVYAKGGKRFHGTAFLIEGGTLHPGLAGRLVALTAAHVVSRFGGLRPREAVLKFTRHPKVTCEFEVKELYASPEAALDFCILELLGPLDGLLPLAVRPHEHSPDRIGDIGSSRRVCSTIGHANGRELALSYSDLIDVGPKQHKPEHQIFLHYTASTLGGNSGGPVYDDDWNVLGLHQAGIKPELMTVGIDALSVTGKKHVANEGISLKTIAHELGSRWETAPVVAQTADPLHSKWQRLEAAISAADTPESNIAALFDDLDAADVPADTAARLVHAPAPSTGDTEREAYRNASDLFWYGGAVALSKAFRARRNTGFTQARKRNPDGLVFVSEGDSWFQYPRPGVRDVIDHLSDTYPIYCRAIAGMEFEKIFANTQELMAAIGDIKPDGILLSGGGNDLLGDGVVVNYVRDFDAALAPADYLIPKLAKKIESIVELFEELVSHARAINPDLKFFLHGYDRALPKRGQPWLDVPLSENRHIKDRMLQRRIVAGIVDAFNERLAVFAQQHTGVHYVDCRGLVGEHAEDWQDELHPKTPGFGRVADEFRRAIRRAFKDHRSIKRDLRNLNS